MMTKDKLDGLGYSTPVTMSANELRLIHKVMVRLYSEKRMTGDEMRDNAQLLQAAFDNAEEEA